MYYNDYYYSNPYGLNFSRNYPRVVVYNFAIGDEEEAKRHLYAKQLRAKGKDWISLEELRGADTAEFDPRAIAVAKHEIRQQRRLRDAAANQPEAFLGEVIDEVGRGSRNSVALHKVKNALESKLRRLRE